MESEKALVSYYPDSQIRISFIEKYSSLLLPFIMLVVDYLAVLVGLGVAYFLRILLNPILGLDFGFDIFNIYTFLIVPAIFLTFLQFDRMYIRRMPFWQMTEKLFKSSTYAILAIIVIMYFTGVANTVSRTYVFMVWLFSFVSLVCFRYAVKRYLNAFGLLQLPIILIGAGKTAELLVRSFTVDAGLGYKIVGIIEDNPQESPIKGQYPILGTFDNAEKIVKRTGVQNVVIAAPGLEKDKFLNLVYRLQPHVRKIAFVPDLFGVPVSGMEVETLFNEKTVMLKVRNNLSVHLNRIFKYCFDMMVTLLGMVFAMPLFVVIGLLIYIDCPGPVIFKHKRVGFKGEEFPCYKFRTMVVNSKEELERHLKDNPAAREEWERDFKLKNDPRVTKIGAFLRKTSLDELPQLFNVLKGEMSLVGPRPIVQAEISRYDEYINDYYMVRPGITGMWQVSGRNDIDYSERVQIDSWYVRNWSIWLDIILLAKTIKVVVQRKGAY
jgi:Undecaprenyl-phosphate galactose phosphotransferase WbaP